MNFSDLLSSSPLILTECAIAERLRRKEGISLHPLLFNTPLLYDAAGKREMSSIYRQYRDIAADAELPILICAPTWRLDRNRIKEGGFSNSILVDALDYMAELKSKWVAPNSPLYTGALLGPKNDCYSPELALTEKEAMAFHQWQVQQITESGTDCIIAQTMPALSESLGMAHLLSDSRIPYILSFVINRKGRLLDATPLPEAMTKVDNTVKNQPLGYMVNCVYPTFVSDNYSPTDLAGRLVGIQANSSSKDHEDLDGSDILHRDDLHHWGRKMLQLNTHFGVKILGGCCGTDHDHLRYIAEHHLISQNPLI